MGFLTVTTTTTSAHDGDVGTTSENDPLTATNHMQAYTDIPRDDEDSNQHHLDAGDDNGGDDEGFTPVLRKGQRHRQPPQPMTAQPWTQICLFVWLLLLSVLVTLCVYLLNYRDTSPVPYNGIKPFIGGDNSNTASRSSVLYDPSVLETRWDPFNLSGQLENRSPLVPPSLSWKVDDEEGLGYATQPDIVKDEIVFVSEGDIYWTRLSSKGNRNMPAVKLTTTIGNVRDPKINPVYPNLIAYTATYASRRDVYLLDLSQRKSPTQRLTYWAAGAGVNSVVGWKDDGKTLVFSAPPLSSLALPDVRIFELALQQDGKKKSPPALQIQPIPLAQALDGAFSSEDCVYFTRFHQSSWTARYVGGSAESLWAYCKGQELAVPITSDYNGTSKDPSIRIGKEGSYLFFLSDRSFSKTGWKPNTMNLWAMRLPTVADLYDRDDKVKLHTPIQLTRASCQFNGRAIQDYGLDSATGGVVLRIGADLHYLSPESIEEGLTNAKPVTVPDRLQIQILSDFHEQQERIIPVRLPQGLTNLDAFDTTYGSTSLLMTIRGQVWVVPVEDHPAESAPYQGAGQNLPSRRYRVLPGQMTGGSVRILTAVHVPLYGNDDDPPKGRVAVVLATDPLSPTAEHAFYLIPIQAGSINNFADLTHLPTPFLGGHGNGGSVKDGGLGSVDEGSIAVSACGRRMAWIDKDGRICVMNLPLYGGNSTSSSYQVLPPENELGEPMNGGRSRSLTWSPGGRYLAVEHSARNQFDIITIVDCGNPNSNNSSVVADIQIGRALQFTPSRFNCRSVFWGKSATDIYLNQHLTLLSKLLKLPEPDDVATTIYFLSDRDIVTDVSSPWGPRAPMPHFPYRTSMYALPLNPKDVEGALGIPKIGRFPGGGALELNNDVLSSFDKKLKDLSAAALGGVAAGRKLKDESMTLRRVLKERRLSTHNLRSIQRYLNETDADEDDPTAPQSLVADVVAESKSQRPLDMDIDFGQADLTLARTAYRLANIPEGTYAMIVSQTLDDGSLVVVEKADATPEGDDDDDDDSGMKLKVFMTDSFPSDEIESVALSTKSVLMAGASTSRQHLVFLFATNKSPRVVPNSMAAMRAFLADMAGKATSNIADVSSMAMSVWPSLEYQQMYADAWRMLRDYFYDVDMHRVDWRAIYDRYKDLVGRCSKREELDDVLGQMASELSALHVFVYGGEYSSPLRPEVAVLNFPASLGAELIRSPEWKGYMVTDIAEPDPDFNLLDGSANFSPLSDGALQATGQRGLTVGDVIVGINGESVMSVPDIHMLLRGMAGQSVRLEVLRIKSGATGNSTNGEFVPEPVVTVPVDVMAAAGLRYDAWEWRTRQNVAVMAKEAGFTAGYIHMKHMLQDDENAFARSFFPNYDRDALILDFRNNGGGNIDSWILDVLQRKAWGFWGDRIGVRKGDLDWDEQFAFRGHVVVLVNEHTASDGEGVARGISELGLGRLIGKRTWGGGIWLASDNRLVDGGIASAPEIGTFNSKFGWGLGIEQHGVVPDIEVDNNPRTAFDGKDTQLERAIAELKVWLQEEPIPEVKAPGPKPNMSLQKDDCPA